MAKLPEEILTRVFTIQQQLLERINEATKIEYQLLELDAAQWTRPSGRECLVQ